MYVIVKSWRNLREPSFEALIENQEPEKRSFENINLEQSSIACVMGKCFMVDRKIKEHGKFHFQSARDVIQLNLLPIPSSNLLRKQKMHFTLQTYLL